MKNSSASNSGAVIFTILFSAALLYTNGIVKPQAHFSLSGKLL